VGPHAPQHPAPIVPSARTQVSAHSRSWEVVLWPQPVLDPARVRTHEECAEQPGPDGPFSLGSRAERQQGPASSGRAARPRSHFTCRGCRATNLGDEGNRADAGRAGGGPKTGGPEPARPPLPVIKQTAQTSEASRLVEAEEEARVGGPGALDVSANAWAAAGAGLRRAGSTGDGRVFPPDPTGVIPTSMPHGSLSRPPAAYPGGASLAGPRAAGGAPRLLCSATPVQGLRAARPSSSLSVHARLLNRCLRPPRLGRRAIQPSGGLAARCCSSCAAPAVALLSDTTAALPLADGLLGLRAAPLSAAMRPLRRRDGAHRYAPRISPHHHPRSHPFVSRLYQSLPIQP
jgi:hypothetical protein